MLIEAMSHGLPVIASDVPVGKELLGDKSFGFLFENGNPASLAGPNEPGGGIGGTRRAGRGGESLCRGVRGRLYRRNMGKTILKN